VTGFPGPGVLRRLRPTRALRQASRLSASRRPDTGGRYGTHAGGSHVHCHSNQPESAGFRAGTWSRGVTQPVSLVYLPVSLTAPVPSGSAGTTRLRRGCSRPPRRPAAQAASSFTPPLRRPGDRGLPPPFGQTAPRGARTAQVYVRITASVWPPNLPVRPLPALSAIGRITRTGVPRSRAYGATSAVPP
jgi:hypothetical protein